MLEVATKTNVEQLEETLRGLIEGERQSFIRLFSERIEKQVQHFLEKRQPNAVAHEFYHGYVPEGILEATDYDEAIRAAKLHMHNRKTRPDFPVVRRPDAAERIKALAERHAEELIRAFLGRALEKLGPVVERKGAYTIEKVTDRWGQFAAAAGNWEGNLHFSFDDGTKFSASLKIITNYSKFHVPYGQYPMRFYDCVLDPAAEREGRLGAASIEQVWGSVGYVPPPPPRKPRWTSIVPGSVLFFNGQHAVINGKLGVKAKDLPAGYEQVARITAGQHGASVEYADGSPKQRYTYTEEQVAEVSALEKEYKFNDASLLRRQFAFQAFFPSS